MKGTYVIQSQVLNKILETQNYDFIKVHGLDETFFRGFENEFNFIKEHYEKHGTVPDKLTFLENFQDFGLYDVNETDDYLLDRIVEEQGFYRLHNVMTEVSKKAKEDSRAAYYYLIENLEKIKPYSISKGADIIKNADERLIIEDSSLTTPISTGLNELDDIFNGGLSQGEELLTIVGRTGSCKSWLNMKFLQEAHNQGKRVGLYSGEMSAKDLGYRFDTLSEHYSNRMLNRGIHSDKYKEYIENLKDKDSSFKIVTQKDFGGRPTAQHIRNFIEANNIQIMGIDQYSLMEDSRAKSNDPYRLKLGHITEDLFAISSEYKIPIIGLAQANRDATKKDNSVPHLEDIKESDDISHNSSKCIGISNVNGRLHINIIKNRHGRSGDKLLYNWDIDNGYIEYVPSTNDSVDSSVKEKIIIENKEKFHIPSKDNPF